MIDEDNPPTHCPFFGKAFGPAISCLSLPSLPGRNGYEDTKEHTAANVCLDPDFLELVKLRAFAESAGASGMFFATPVASFAPHVPPADGQNLQILFQKEEHGLLHHLQVLHGMAHLSLQV
jgi:hypothetical protein